jgi:hypothetical protein
LLLPYLTKPQNAKLQKTINTSAAPVITSRDGRLSTN